MGRASHGYEFESQVGNSLERYCNIGEGKRCFYIKLVDTKIFDLHIWCNHCGKRVSHNLILPKALADFFVAFRGKEKTVQLIECKSSEAPSFPIANIAEHQLEFASELESLGVPYWFVIQDKRTKVKRCRALSGMWMIDLIREVKLEKGRSSIPWDLIHERGIEIRWCSYGLWALEDLFDE